jgi:hypothetical protein
MGIFEADFAGFARPPLVWNMGGGAVPVKSTDVEGGPGGYDELSRKLQNTSLELWHLEGYGLANTRIRMLFF